MKVHVINLNEDFNKSYKVAQNYPNIEKIISTPIGLNEFYEACKNYPILFTKDVNKNWIAILLLGFNDRNLFLDENKKFKADKYVPAIFRSYPFFAIKNETNETFLLGIDDDFIEVSDKNNQNNRFFNEDKTSSDFSKEVLDFLLKHKQDLSLATTFVKDLDEIGLLVEQSVSFTDEDKKVHNINGFYIISEEKLNTLSDKKRALLNKKNMIPLVTTHLISLSNIKRMGL